MKKVYCELKNGGAYTGHQITNNGSFKIEMTIDSINFKTSYICGTFKIYNLTRHHELISTYFEGEIVGRVYPFDYNKYFNKNISKDQEEKHWRIFPEWKQEYITNPNLYNPETNKYLYLRVKEIFILPDPNVTNIPGASIEGLYYFCYYKAKDVFAGFYYFKDAHSISTQYIILEGIKKNTFASYEIR
ncbi:Glucose-induced degradation protein 4 like protein [Astathelohania contejeani]|uniref:Glucose-induced degradation protein 4 like protein n=1 Tax=Astathelohania contejeani TaxID=164912 RepID=A0ABQ7I273_9MICR|nr:Glucose-induced degradation protein 4 like protein [Thelohania contejeani]